MGLKIKHNFIFRDYSGLCGWGFFYFIKWGGKKKRIKCSTQVKHSSAPEGRPSTPQHRKRPRAMVHVIFTSEGSS